MSGPQEVIYTLDFEVRRRGGRQNQARAGPAKRQRITFRASPG